MWLRPLLRANRLLWRCARCLRKPRKSATTSIHTTVLPSTGSCDSARRPEQVVRQWTGVWAGEAQVDRLRAAKVIEPVSNSPSTSTTAMTPDTVAALASAPTPVESGQATKDLTVQDKSAGTNAKVPICISGAFNSEDTDSANLAFSFEDKELDALVLRSSKPKPVSGVPKTPSFDISNAYWGNVPNASNQGNHSIPLRAADRPKSPEMSRKSDGYSSQNECSHSLLRPNSSPYSVCSICEKLLLVRQSDGPRIW